MSLISTTITIIFFQLLISFGTSDDKLFVARGTNALTSVEMINLDNPEESKILTDFPTGTAYGEAWMLDNSTILMCGGYEFINKTCAMGKCYTYSLNSNMWSLMPNQPDAPTIGSIFFNIPNKGKVIVGGFTEDKFNKCTFRACDKVSTFNKNENKWITDTFPIEKQKPLTFGCGVQIDETTSWIASWTKVFNYNWNTKEFTEKNKLPYNGKYEMACSFYPKTGKIIIAGIYTSHMTSSVIIYDPLTDTYTDGPDLPVPISQSKLTLVNKDRLILSGGLFKNHTYSKSLYEYYSEGEGGWKKLDAEMKHPRSNHNAIGL